MKGLYALEMIEAGKNHISESTPGRENEFFNRAHRLIKQYRNRRIERG